MRHDSEIYWKDLSKCPFCEHMIPWKDVKSSNEYQCPCGAIFTKSPENLVDVSSSIFNPPWNVHWIETIVEVEHYNSQTKTIFMHTSTGDRNIRSYHPF